MRTAALIAALLASTASFLNPASPSCHQGNLFDPAHVRRTRRSDNPAGTKLGKKAAKGTLTLRQGW